MQQKKIFKAMAITLTCEGRTFQVWRGEALLQTHYFFCYFMCQILILDHPFLFQTTIMCKFYITATEKQECFFIHNCLESDVE